MTNHAIASPSKLQVLELCPGRLRAEMDAREKGMEESVSPAAEAGTRCHALMEGRLLDPTRGFFADTDTKPEEVVLADALWQELTERKHPSVVIPADCDRWVEEKVEVGQAISMLTKDPNWAHKEAIWGTLDLGMAYGNVFEIVDWKFGNRPVQPGIQLMAYAVGLGKNLDWYGKHQMIARNGVVRLTIAQPTRVPMIDSIDFPVSSLVTWAEKIKKIVNGALDPAAARIPGDDQCRFCLASGFCAERLKASSQALFSAVEETVPEEPTVEDIAEVAEMKFSGDPEDLTPAQMGRIMDEAPRIEGFFKAVREEAYRRLEAGEAGFEKQSGWKLVTGKRKREWSIPEEEQEQKLRGIGLALKDIYPKKIATLNQLDAVAKSKSKKVQERFANLWKWAEGKPVLAPEGDERPSILEEMFEKIEEPEEDAPPPWL